MLVAIRWDNILCVCEDWLVEKDWIIGFLENEVHEIRGHSAQGLNASNKGKDKESYNGHGRRNGETAEKGQSRRKGNEPRE